MLAFAAAAVMAASPSPTGPPIRDVVYRVSFTRHERLNEESFGGGTAPQPAVQGADETDAGTITIDVMAVAENNLGIRLIESWNQHPRPSTFLGNVGPDGAVHFGGQPISEEASALLPLFGPLWMNGEPADVGAKWTTKLSTREVDINTAYHVTHVDGDTVTIEETQNVRVLSARGLDGVTSGTIVYKPSLLVPVSVRLDRRSSRGDADHSDVETMIITITRLSDSLDPGK